MEKYELITVLVNNGFSEVVMDAAREEGARGGTIVNARGTGNKELGKRYNIVITPDKEMVLIVANSQTKDKILAAVYKAAGLGTNGQGIAFSIPINDVVGLKFDEVSESTKKQ